MENKEGIKDLIEAYTELNEDGKEKMEKIAASLLEKQISTDLTKLKNEESSAENAAKPENID